MSTRVEIEVDHDGKVYSWHFDTTPELADVFITNLALAGSHLAPREDLHEVRRSSSARIKRFELADR